MAERNDPALLAAVPGASLASLEAPRAAVLAAEIARLDGLVAAQSAASLELFDEPAAFTRALKALA